MNLAGAGGVNARSEVQGGDCGDALRIFREDTHLQFTLHAVRAKHLSNQEEGGL